MSCHGNNATPASPAIAPGGESIDPGRAAEKLVGRWEGGVDPRVRELVSGFDAPFFQAGLAGYSDAAMRIVARRHGCPFCVTEALLDRTLLAGGRGFAKADLGDIAGNVPGGDEDHPLAGQIMGSDPKEMAAGALKMVEQGTRHDKAYRNLAYKDGVLPEGHLRLPGGEQLPRSSPPGGRVERSEQERVSSNAPVHQGVEGRTFATIDVNLACPVKKIKSKARGGHWLAEPDGAIEILEGVREAVPAHIPVTMKVRRSFDDTPEMAERFERLLDAAFAIGIAWATVHARSVQQKYIGPSRWDLLREIVRRHPDKLLFGSGDVWEAGDVFRMIDYTGVSGVSVARGCIGNPWIFRQCRDILAGREPAPPTIGEQRRVLEEHFELALSVNAGMRDAQLATGKQMRKFGIRFAAHHPQGEAVRQRMIAISSIEDWRAVLEEFYSEEMARA